MSRPQHGGDLARAAAEYGRPLQDWLDLSTGINPHIYPVPTVPAEVWQALPDTDGRLEQAAAGYYGAANLLAVPGSQAAISLIPQLFKPARVGVLAPGFAEHAYCWQQARHEVVLLAADQINAQLPSLTYLVVINPCNPTGARFSREQLLGWHQQLAARGGCLVVDEAFIDADSVQSLVQASAAEGLVVLRSVGKFFGLAGIRLGFVFAAQAVLQKLKAQLQPWAVSHPARWVGEQALADVEWQALMRNQLAADQQRLVSLLRAYGLKPDGGCALFQWLQHTQAAEIKQQLAQQGIWVREFTEAPSLRFGLPGREAQWQRLEQALQQVVL